MMRWGVLFCVSGLDVDAVVLFDFAHDEGGFDGGEALDLTQFVEHELLVLLHVGGAHLQQVVVVARRVVALRDLRNPHHASGEGVGNLVVDLLQLHLAEHLQAQVQLVGIEQRHVLLDVAEPLQPLLSLEDGCGRQVDGVGQFLGCQLRVLL